MRSRIKVGFDISQLAHIGGVSVYTQNIAAFLQEDNELDMVFFYSSLRIPYRGDLKNVRKYRLPPTLFEMLFNRLRNTNIEKFVGPVDIYHSSDWVQPPSKARKITTYHDVIPLKYPHWSHPKIVEVHKRRLQIVEKEIDAVIAVSETTKHDLMEISGIPSSKIYVIYEGIEHIFRPQPKDKIQEFKKKYNLPDEFVLAIGGIGERRNITRIKQACGDYKIVISGETIPYIKRSELPLLYSSAKVMAYVSLYEGFGLPIIESMACGTPVVTANTSSMKELATGYALLADPLNTDHIHQQLQRVMTDDALREDLIAKGLKYSRKFSWKTSAQKTAELYKKLAAE